MALLQTSPGRGVGFAAEKRVVRALAPVARVIADLGSNLVSENGDSGTVEIKDQARAVLGPVDEMLQQSVVEAMNLFPETVRRLE
jgi:hypothetical protein